MRYEVRVKKQALKRLESLPYRVQKKFNDLQADLRKGGPWQPDWPNYSKLGPDAYHCHLDYAHVACWSHDKNTILVEVYYVGSRQGAPY